jgi:alpha-1,3/alpha-1,6-mannosyltransferase
MKVCVLHLDLGIGGAEQLIVNISCCLKELKHNITILTTHHDKNHCFEETKNNGLKFEKKTLYEFLLNPVFTKILHN